MSILISKDTKVITQGITGKTGQFHTRMCRDYANGKNCFVAGVNPKKAGSLHLDLPVFSSVAEAKKATGAYASVIYVRLFYSAHTLARRVRRRAFCSWDGLGRVRTDAT